MKLETRQNIFKKAPFIASMIMQDIPQEAYSGDQIIDDTFVLMPVFPIGKFAYHDGIGGEYEITEADLDQFIENFNNGVIGSDLPLYEEHDLDAPKRPAMGWLKDLIKRPDGLWALVKPNPVGREKILNQEYRYISPEWHTDYTKPQNGQDYHNVLAAKAMTNEPYFDTMPALTASTKKITSSIQIINNQGTMLLQELLQKPVAELTDEEKGFLKEHEAELSDEQKATYKELLEVKPKEDDKPKDEPKNDAEVKTENKQPDGDDDKKDPKNDTPTDPGAKVEVEDDKTKEPVKPTAESAPAVEEVPVITTAQPLAASLRGKDVSLKIKASVYESLYSDHVELHKSKIVASLEKTHELPAVVDAATKFALRLEAGLQKDFLELMGQVTSKVLNTARKSSKEDTTYASAQEEMISRAKEMMKKEKITYKEAIEKVKKQDKGLAKRFADERSKK